MAANLRSDNLPPVALCSTGIPGLDDVLAGGLTPNRLYLLEGVPGSGKTTLAMQFLMEGARRGEPVLYVTLSESEDELRGVAASHGWSLEGITVRELAPSEDSLRPDDQYTMFHPSEVELGETIDPAELCPGEFTHAIRHAVETLGVTIVVIDSLNGYLNAMPGEKFLVVQLHELLSYLGQSGVATLLIGAHQGLIGSAMITPEDASYLADAVILMRYYKTKGEVRQAISVMKKRGGAHERTIRDARMENGGIHIGPPLREFGGVLTGVPIHEKDEDKLGARDRP